MTLYYTLKVSYGTCIPALVTSRTRTWAIPTAVTWRRGPRFGRGWSGRHFGRRWRWAGVAHLPYRHLQACRRSPPCWRHWGSRCSRAVAALRSELNAAMRERIKEGASVEMTYAQDWCTSITMIRREGPGEHRKHGRVCTHRFRKYKWYLRRMDLFHLGRSVTYILSWQAGVKQLITVKQRSPHPFPLSYDPLLLLPPLCHDGFAVFKRCVLW